MPRWTPELQWKGQDAYIIGGGPSLREFDFNRLRGKNTIGCNSAFLLGSHICSLCFFSDPMWFNSFFNALCQYGGRVVTHCEEIPDHQPWVWKMERRDEGLFHDALGFGGNTGCGAINLALVLGARRVFLLGFDCKVQADAQMNWHQHRCEPANTSAELFEKFRVGFQAVADQLFKFPGAEVINLGPDSALEMFPKMKLDEVLA